MVKSLVYSVFICSYLIHSESFVIDSQKDTKNDRLIDSLIIINEINENVLLISFGADAITAIKTPNGIVVIDAGISTGLTTLYRKRIENHFPGAKFMYVINTHAHHDHYRGNSVFAEVRVVGHINSLQEIDKQCKNPEKTVQSLRMTTDEYEQKLIICVPYSTEWIDNYTQWIRYGYACNDASNKLAVKLPDLTFFDSLSIDMGGITFEIIYFGKCHSNSDILIFSPELKLLFSGDLFFKYGRLSTNYDNADKARWLRATDWLNKRKPQIKTVIGGHGQIMQLEDLEAFEKNIIRQAGGSSE